MQKLIISLAILFSFSAASAANEVALKFVKAIPLPEVDGRIDHFRDRREGPASIPRGTCEEHHRGGRSERRPGDAHAPWLCQAPGRALCPPVQQARRRLRRGWLGQNA